MTSSEMTMLMLVLLTRPAAGPPGAAGSAGAAGAAGPPGPDMAPGPRDIGTTDATDVALRVNGVAVLTLLAGGTTTQLGSNVTFVGDAAFDVAAPGARVRNLYAANVVTGDLDLRDDAKGVHWKIIEEHEGLRLYNVVTKRSYLLLMEEL